MNGIIGMTELVLDSRLRPEQRDSLETVQSSADSLLTIINDILDFSKIEAGHLEFENMPFNLCAEIEETVRAFAPRAHAKGLELLCELRPGIPETVIGDRTRLRQVVVNLLNNAIKFTERGEVALRVDLHNLSGHRVRLHFTIHDTGIGVAAEKQTLIFEAFSQADGSMTRNFGGTGLGLTIAQRLVEAMHGSIWVDSQPGQGSDFHFTCELGIDEKAPIQLIDHAPLQGASVLVVDDNETSRRVMLELLQSWQLRPSAAANAEDALLVMQRASDREQPYTLVLSDIQMPGMDGFELASRIKTGSPSIATSVVLMGTATERPDDIERSREAGVSSFITKPFRRSDLRTAIVKALSPPASEGKPEDFDTLLTGAAEPPMNAVGSRLSILLAEDNEVNQRVASAILRTRGHLVWTVKNGKEALTALMEQTFDVVLMDIQMPELNGFEATRAIRELEASAHIHVPIIALTAHAMKGDEERCLAAGMDAYISKPIRAGRLLEVIEQFSRPRPEQTLAS
jgi:two-component system sensor histidine kinase/response regulator